MKGKRAEITGPEQKKSGWGFKRKKSGRKKCAGKRNSKTAKSLKEVKKKENRERKDQATGQKTGNQKGGKSMIQEKHFKGGDTRFGFCTRGSKDYAEPKGKKKN